MQERSAAGSSKSAIAWAEPSPGWKPGGVKLTRDLTEVQRPISNQNRLRAMSIVDGCEPSPTKGAVSDPSPLCAVSASSNPRPEASARGTTGCFAMSRIFRWNAVTAFDAERSAAGSSKSTMAETMVTLRSV